MNKYKPVIGLEIHVELKTKSKMFCQCEANYFGKIPNTNTCPVCLGLPGALPVPNKKAIEWTILIGQALNCKVNLVSKFDRKHYFYPDLPKGYQISQYDEPFCVTGRLEIFDKTGQSKKSFGITRVHLEEDTGKLIHQGLDTLVDFNRSGVPLVEIVTEPDFDNSEDVKIFLEELHTIIRYLGVSDADMEKGSMRMEPNISVKVIQSSVVGSQSKTEKPKTDNRLPSYKVEVKNINSFNFVKKAIEYEIDRHIDLLEEGKTPIQETRGFDSKKGMTYSQRSKEEAHDYRYFPEPDIPPLSFTQEYVNSIKIPELPQAKIARYIKGGIRYIDAFTLTRDKKLNDKFEEIFLRIQSSDHVKAVDVVNALINRIDLSFLPPDEFYKKLKEIKAPKKTDEKLLENTIDRLIILNKKVVDDYKKGKENAIMYLVGQVMREMQGKADARVVRQKLEEKLKS